MLKAQYYLANTASGDTTQINNLKPAFWPGIGFFGNRRKRMVNGTDEVLEVPLNEAIQGEEKTSSMTRWIFYEMLEKMSNE